MDPIAALFLATVVVFAITAPWLPFLQDPTAQDLARGATPPSPAHWFGTDELGRDTFARVAFGGRISMLVGIVGTLVSLVIGVTWGAIAGYVGGKLDEFMMPSEAALRALLFEPGFTTVAEAARDLEQAARDNDRARLPEERRGSARLGHAGHRGRL